MGVEDSEPTPGASVGPPSSERSRRRRPAKASRAAQYWMIVSSPDNYRKSRELGFTVQGIKSRHRRRVEQMRPGDRLLYYVTGRTSFTASVTLTSPMFEDHTPLWRSSRRDESYPWRVRIRPDRVLEEEQWVPARELAYRMDYVRKWPPEYWTLAFQGHLHQLSQKDFGLVEDELQRSLKAASAAP